MASTADVQLESPPITQIALQGPSSLLSVHCHLFLHHITYPASARSAKPASTHLLQRHRALATHSPEYLASVLRPYGSQDGNYMNNIHPWVAKNPSFNYALLDSVGANAIMASLLASTNPLHNNIAS